MVRLRQANKEIPGPRASDGVYGVVAPWDPKNPVSESLADRIWVATQRGSWRLERDWQRDSGASGTSVHVCDGVTKWLPTARGAFHSHPADAESSPARMLLDPSWLIGYDWGTPRRDRHNNRDVLVLHAQRVQPASPEPGAEDNQDARIVGRQPPPAEVEVVVDAEYGFLHRMTGIINGEPFVVSELLDLLVDPPLDKEIFRIDPSKSEVVVAPKPALTVNVAVGPALPEPPPPAWSDLGAIAENLQEDLDDRVARLPLGRLRKWSDLILLQAVENDHVNLLARRYSLSGPDRLALQGLWFDRIDAELEETTDQLRYDLWTRERRISHRLGKYHLLHRLWFNTFGPGGETWFADHLPVRRFLFRLHWRP
jgi:hypothetical protein